MKEENSRLIKICLFIGILLFMLIIAYKTYAYEAITGATCTGWTTYVENNGYDSHSITSDNLNYLTYEQAMAAAVSYVSALEAMYPDYVNSGVLIDWYTYTTKPEYPGCWDSVDATGNIVARVYDNDGEGTDYWVGRIFWYKAQTGCDNECYVEWRGVKDSSDNWLAVTIVTTEGRQITYGDTNAYDDCMNGLISGCYIWENPLTQYDLDNADPETCNNMCDPETDLGLSEAGSSGSDPIETTPPEEEKGTDGEPAEGGDTDNELLAKIANNTSETANNTDGLEEGLTDLERQLIKANDLLDSIANNNIDSEPTPETVAKQGALDAVEDMTDEEAEEFGFTEEDYGIETTIGSFLDTMTADNPINDFLDQVSLTSSNPVCSIDDTITMFGSSVDLSFSFCEWEDVIDLMGLILFVLSGVAFIWIVFKL